MLSLRQHAGLRVSETELMATLKKAESLMMLNDDDDEEDDDDGD